MVIGGQVVPDVFDRGLGVAESEKCFHRDFRPPLSLVLTELPELAMQFAPGGCLFPGKQLRLARESYRADRPAGRSGLPQGLPSFDKEQATQGEIAHY
ncbi:hypothetical protein GCM10022244_29550 [Streptomyces gulbargensis]|uniref:Uncharacterized protein n=1 Tax=Streptomyces gulbargensis TaxID=364901 RepID=A0ABP7MAN9_9ACTN